MPPPLWLTYAPWSEVSTRRCWPTGDSTGPSRHLVLAVALPVEATIDLPDARLSPPVESAAYFAVAEALANVVKHSEARSAGIHVHYGDGSVVRGGR